MMKLLILSYLLSTILVASGHPLCYNAQYPTAQPNLTICKAYVNQSCCDPAREYQVVNNYVSTHRSQFSVNFNINNPSTWTACDKQVLNIPCTHCDPFEYHLYESDANNPIICKSYCQQNLSQCGVSCTGNLASTDIYCYPVTLQDVPTSLHGVRRLFGSVEVGPSTDLDKTSSDLSAYYIAEQAGIVWRIYTNNGGSSWNQQLNPTFMDISSQVNSVGELGLLGFRFDLNYSIRNCYIYAFYTTKSAGSNNVNTLSRFHVPNCQTGNPANLRVDVTTECKMIQISKSNTNHNGGDIQLDKSGNLFLSVGDGGGEGGSGSTGGPSQVLSNLFGKIIKIVPGKPSDPYSNTSCVGSNNYTVPTSNPFYNKLGVMPEIWALGFRNPWSSDLDNGVYFTGDVGQGRYEEIDNVTAGGNYGWAITEGNGTYGSSTDADLKALVNYKPPVLDYRHSDSNALHPRTVPNVLGYSLTYGHKYRGNILPAQYRNLNPNIETHIVADFYNYEIMAFFVNKTSGNSTGEVLIYNAPPIARIRRGHNNETLMLSYYYSGDPSTVYVFNPLVIPVCGNYMCEQGESCTNCYIDCPGVVTGPKSQKWCCAEGLCSFGNCTSSCLGTVPPNIPDHKNGFCEPSEDSYNAPYDCPYRTSPGNLDTNSFVCFGFKDGAECGTPYGSTMDNTTINGPACLANSDPCNKGNKQGVGNGKIYEF